MGRGVAGMMRTSLERVIEQDKQVGVRKAKAMRIEGLVLLSKVSIPSLLYLADGWGGRRVEG